MIWLILVPIAFALATQSLFFSPDAKRYNAEIGDYAVNGIGVIFITVLAFVVAVGMGCFCRLFFHKHEVSKWRDDLAVIRVKDETTGNSFLGSGSIKGDQYYFFYYKNDDGSVTPGKIESSWRVKVYEEDRKDAVLETSIYVEDNPRLANIFSIAGSDPGSNTFKFHVPKGTVIQGFSM